jgi:hypothetical protein
VSRRQCCCGGGGTEPEVGSCTDLPTAWNSRQYRINLPDLYPLVLGRVIPDTPPLLNDLGILPGNENHPGWDIPYCEYHNDLYYYNPVRLVPDCLLSPFYWRAFGPCQPFRPASGITFATNTMSATGVQRFKSFFQSTSSSSPNCYWQSNVTIYRCAECAASAFSNIASQNRSLLILQMFFRGRFSMQDCEGANAPFNTRNANSEYQAIYASDPWTAAEGIGDTFYLKNLQHSLGIYEPCDTADGVWTVDNQCRLSTAKGTLLDFPINIVPTEITVDRIA